MNWNKGLLAKKVLEAGIRYLQKKGIENPRRIAEIFLSEILSISPEKLYVYPLRIKEKELKRFWDFMKRRVAGEPVQYILGKWSFWTFELKLNPYVLIPRPETELLVEHSVEILKNLNSPHVLDLGTGSGAIAIAIAKEIPNAKIWATDISAEAIDIAICNAKMNNTADRIVFIKGDLWEPVKEKRFHLIVTNPPYVAEEEYESLPREVKWEPKIALCGGQGGLKVIKRIIMDAHRFLYPNCWLIMEIAPHQKEAVEEMLKETGNYSEIEAIKDYSGRFRVIKAKRRE